MAARATSAGTGSGALAETTLTLTGSFTIGDWIADANSLRLKRAGVEHALEPRAFAVLRYLCERPQQLVTIDELMDELWRGVVVTPNAVTRVIAQLRRALDDDAKQPKYIETVARSGYRLIAPVRVAEFQRSHRTSLLIGSIAAVSAIALLAWVLVPAPHDPSVAVLPFENYTGDASLDYLGDGVAEEVINSLAQIPDLHVSARTLSFAVQDRADLEKVARNLGVSYIVEGSVRQSGDHLRITAQLIAADTGSHVWSRTAEHGVREIFKAQDAISQGVAGAMRDELGLALADVSEAATSAPDPESYDLYLKGRYVWHRRGKEPVQQAVDYFAEAVKIDPSFAKGWAALASAYVTWPGYSPKGWETWHLAEEAALKARALDPAIPEVYGILATFAERRLDWIAAHELFQEGVRRGPRSATAHYWLSEHFAKTGRFHDAVRHLAEVERLDPLYVAPRMDTGFAYLMFGDIDGGIVEFEKLRAEGVDTPVAWTGYFIALVLAAEFETVRNLIESSSFPPAQKLILQRYIDLEAGSGDRRALVDAMFNGEGTRIPHPIRAWAGSRIGAFDEVLEMMRARVERDQPVETRALWGPQTRLVEDPGFPGLAESLGLVEYWRQIEWNDFCAPAGDSLECDGDALTPGMLDSLLGGDRS